MTKGGSPCHFPFTHRGVEYTDSCAPKWGGTWCYTDKAQEMYDYCSEDAICKESAETISTTATETGLSNRVMLLCFMLPYFILTRRREGCC